MAPRDQALVRGFPPVTKPQKHASLPQERAPTLLPLQPLGQGRAGPGAVGPGGRRQGAAGHEGPSFSQKGRLAGETAWLREEKGPFGDQLYHLGGILRLPSTPCRVPVPQVAARINREFLPTLKCSRTEGALWFRHDWEVPGDPAVCPLSSCSPESHHRCPNPSLPSHRGLCSLPPSSQQKGWSQTEISGLFSKGPEFSGGCRSGPGGHWGGGGAQGAFPLDGVLGATDPTETGHFRPFRMPC